MKFAARAAYEEQRNTGRQAPSQPWSGVHYFHQERERKYGLGERSRRRLQISNPVRKLRFVRSWRREARRRRRCLRTCELFATCSDAAIREWRENVGAECNFLRIERTLFRMISRNQKERRRGRSRDILRNLFSRRGRSGSGHASAYMRKRSARVRKRVCIIICGRKVVHCTREVFYICNAPSSFSKLAEATHRSMRELISEA